MLNYFTPACSLIRRSVVEVLRRVILGLVSVIGRGPFYASALRAGGSQERLLDGFLFVSSPSGLVSVELINQAFGKLDQLLSSGLLSDLDTSCPPVKGGFYVARFSVCEDGVFRHYSHAAIASLEDSPSSNSIASLLSLARFGDEPHPGSSS